MSYSLQNMLKIRIKREDRASADLSAARNEVNNALRTLEERKEELRAYEDSKEERRDRIYENVIGREVSREELDLVLEGIARIDEEGALKADNVVMAESVLKTKEELADKARVEFARAARERMKIEEHKTAWLAEEQKASEHRLETELEDFSGKKSTENINDD